MGIGMFPPSLGGALNDFLGLFGAKGGKAGAVLDMLTMNPLGALVNLHDAYVENITGRGTGPIDRAMIQGLGVAPPGFMPPPSMMLPITGPLSGAGFAGGIERMDLGAGASHAKFLGYMDPQRRESARFERFLNRNPQARAAFEASVGGLVVPDGRNDGVLTIQRFAPGFAPIPGFAQNPLANTALSTLAGMEQAVLAQASMLGGGGLGAAMMGVNPFMGMTLGGLSGIAGGLTGMGTLGGGMGFGFGGLGTPIGGTGAGSWNPLAMPGRINNTNPAYERAHQAEVDSVLRDPSLTVEDKVTLMLMLIMKKMDKDIERQMEYVNSIQQQQSNRGGGKGGKGGGVLGTVGGLAGTAFGGPVGGMIGSGLGSAVGGALTGQNGGNSPSIDVETMKLKRMIDKRSQMFDMLRQIIDKYNETAKGIIQSMGR